MRCRRCGQEMKVKPVEVGKDAQGNPIYNDYAFCYECKIKINLDKKKGKSVNPTDDKAVTKAPEKAEENTLLEGMEIPEELKKAQEPPKEDLSLTRQFEAQVEQLVAKDVEEEPEVNPTYVEEVKVQEKKAPKKKPEKKPDQKKPEQKKPEKKAEGRAKEQPERKPAKRPERPKKETQKQQERRLNEIPEKRVKEVRAKTKKKKGKGIIKFLVFVLIMAALGAAIYFNRETVKGWINVGLEKFDAMTDKKDEKKDNKEDDATTDIEDIVDQIDAASDESGNGTEGTEGTDGADAAEPAADSNATDGANADGADAPTE